MSGKSGPNRPLGDITNTPPNQKPILGQSQPKPNTTPPQPGFPSTTGPSSASVPKQGQQQTAPGAPPPPRPSPPKQAGRSFEDIANEWDKKSAAEKDGYAKNLWGSQKPSWAMPPTGAEPDDRYDIEYEERAGPPSGSGSGSGR